MRTIVDYNDDAGHNIKGRKWTKHVKAKKQRK